MGSRPVLVLALGGQGVIDARAPPRGGRRIPRVAPRRHNPPPPPPGDFGTDMMLNIVHASDSPEAAEAEIQRFLCRRRSLFARSERTPGASNGPNSKVTEVLFRDSSSGVPSPARRKRRLLFEVPSARPRERHPNGCGKAQLLETGHYRSEQFFPPRVTTFKPLSWPFFVSPPPPPPPSRPGVSPRPGAGRLAPFPKAPLKI